MRDGARTRIGAAVKKIIETFEHVPDDEAYSILAGVLFIMDYEDLKEQYKNSKEHI